MLRGRKFRGKRALKAFAGFDALRAKQGKYNRRLKRMASSLAQMAIVNRVEPWYGIYKEVKEALLKRGFSRSHADRAARVRLAAKMLVAVAEAVGALP